MRLLNFLILLLHHLCAIVYSLDDQSLYNGIVDHIQQTADGFDFISPAKSAQMEALGAPSVDRQNLTARIVVFATQDFVGRRNHEICDKYLHRSEHCGDYSPNQYLDPCYCVEKTIGDETHHCCDYRGQNIKASVVLNADYIDLSDADFLQLSINVNTINRLSISNISNSVFNSVNDFDRSDIEFHVDNSTVSKLPLIKALNVKESTIKSLEKLNVTNIFSRNSHIYEMKDLKFILEEKRDHESNSKVCFNAVGSKFDSLSNVKIKCNAYLSNTRFGLIKNTETNSIVISNSSIDVIYPYGLHFLSGSAMLEDVIIQHLHREAIFISPGVDLTMVNITVVHCDEPCFLFDIASIRLFTNVTLNGLIINNASDALLAGSRDQYTEDVCKYQKVLNGYNCNLGHLGRNHIELIMQRKQNLTEIVISKHKDVDISEGCYKRITLNEIEGYYHPSAVADPLKGFEQTETCNIGTLLVLKRSTMKTIFSRQLKGLQISYSTIDNLDVDKIKFFFGLRSSIKNIENLIYNDINNDLTMDNMEIGSVKKMTLESPAFIYSSNIDQVVNLVIDHEDKLSTIKDTRINKLIGKGVLIKSGALELDNVLINQTSEGVIDISLDGKLILRNMEAVKWTDCAGFRPIRALGRTQVVYMDSPNPASLRHCISFSGAENMSPFVPSGDIDLSESFTEIGDLPECTQSSKRRLLCDMRKSNLINTTSYLLKDNGKLNQFDEIELHNVQDLVIGEHCFSKINLVDVASRRMETVAHSCYYWLKAFGSSISEITNRVWNLNIQYCEVEELYPSAVVKKIFIARSEIQNLNVIVQHGTFANSTVKNIDKLRVRGDLTITECELENAATESIVVEKNGTLVIANSTIQILDTASITVFGTLVLHNVTVYRAMDESIRLGSSSNISMRNVTFIDATLRVMSLLESANVSAERVVIDGKDATVTHKFPLFSGKRCPPLSSVDQFGRPLVREDECSNIVKSKNSKTSKPVLYEANIIKPPNDIGSPDNTGDVESDDHDNDSDDYGHYISDDHSSYYSSDYDSEEPRTDEPSSDEPRTDYTTDPTDYTTDRTDYTTDPTTESSTDNFPSNAHQSRDRFADKTSQAVFNIEVYILVILRITAIILGVVIMIAVVVLIFIKLYYYFYRPAAAPCVAQASTDEINGESIMMQDMVHRELSSSRKRNAYNETRETESSQEETLLPENLPTEYNDLQIENLRQTGAIPKRARTTTGKYLSREDRDHAYESVSQQDAEGMYRDPRNSLIMGTTTAVISAPPSRAGQLESSFLTIHEQTSTEALAENLVVTNPSAGSSSVREQNSVTLRAVMPEPAAEEMVSRDSTCQSNESFYQNLTSPPISSDENIYVDNNG